MSEHAPTTSDDDGRPAQSAAAGDAGLSSPLPTPSAEGALPSPSSSAPAPSSSSTSFAPSPAPAAAAASATAAAGPPPPSTAAQEFLRARERMYAENVDAMDKKHGLEAAAFAAASTASTAGAAGAAGTDDAVGILKQFNVHIAYSRIAPLREFVGWGEDAPFDIPRGPPEVALRRLVASLNFFGSSYFVVIAAAYLYQAIVDPLLIVATLVLAGFNYYALLLSKAQPALENGGIPLNPDFTFTSFHLKLGLFVLSAIILLVTVGHDVFEVVGISTVFILAHAVLRNSRSAVLANAKHGSAAASPARSAADNNV